MIEGDLLMNRIIKKAASAVLSLTMMASTAAAMAAELPHGCLTLTASAASASYTTATVNNVKYKIYASEKKAIVSGVAANTMSVYIPKTIVDPVTQTTVNVTGMEQTACKGNTKIFTLKIDAHFTTLPASAFQGCLNLISVQLPPTLTAIPAKAFYSTKINKIHLPYTVVNVGSKAFANCSFLKEVYVHRRNVTIASDAFDKKNTSRNAYCYVGSNQTYFTDKGFTVSDMRTGDLNLNYKVDKADAKLLLDEYNAVYFYNQPATFTAEQRRWADVDYDGDFDATDCLILNYLVMFHEPQGSFYYDRYLSDYLRKH